MRGSDVVITATNSGDPVFDGSWLEPGTHLIAMIGANRFDQRREIDDEAVRRSDLIVVNLKEQVDIDQQPELLSPLRKGIRSPTTTTTSVWGFSSRPSEIAC